MLESENPPQKKANDQSTVNVIEFDIKKYPLVLVVDDEPMNFFEMEEMFKIHDFLCKPAIDGKRALEMI